MLRAGDNTLAGDPSPGQRALKSKDRPKPQSLASARIFRPSIRLRTDRRRTREATIGGDDHRDIIHPFYGSLGAG
jgi:hypothetical protein